jgi:release factor glutamine methyltransferase
MKIKDVFEKTVQFFKDKKFETARLDTELLLSHALKIDRVQIYMKYEQPLSEEEVGACRELVRRRAGGEPIAYIIGEKGFYGEIFSVGPGVLIPRPETELIVEQALDFIKKFSIKNPRILDVGAGSGCIGFAILKNCESASLTSVEKSEQAFHYLSVNQQKLDLAGRSKLIHGAFQDIDLSGAEFDVVVANPPYIAKSDTQVETMVQKFEPHEALYSEHEGLGDLREWAKKSRGFLAQPGLMLFEMGHQQGQKMKDYFESMGAFKEVKIMKDLSGLDRVIKSIQ